MYRFAIESLLQWGKEKENRKPLLLMGARQVGKTWLMKEFGKKYYDKVAYISFYNNKRMDDVFQMDFDINRIIMNLNIESGVTITPGDTLIILDEIQGFAKSIRSLRNIFVRRLQNIMLLQRVHCLELQFMKMFHIRSEK